MLVMRIKLGEYKHWEMLTVLIFPPFSILSTWFQSLLDKTGWQQWTYWEIWEYAWYNNTPVIHFTFSNILKTLPTGISVYCIGENWNKHRGSKILACLTVSSYSGCLLSFGVSSVTVVNVCFMRKKRKWI